MGVAFLVNLAFLNGAKKLPDVPKQSLLEYA